jgi:hypothetical protein
MTLLNIGLCKSKDGVPGAGGIHACETSGETKNKSEARIKIFIFSPIVVSVWIKTKRMEVFKASRMPFQDKSLDSIKKVRLHGIVAAEKQ